MAHADELSALAEPFDRARCSVRIGKREPADHAAHEIDLAAQIEKFLRLVALRQDLDQHRPIDVAAFELRAQIVWGEIARKAITSCRRPSVGMTAPPPEMVMRIDHVPVHSGARFSKNACIPMRKS